MTVKQSDLLRFLVITTLVLGNSKIPHRKRHCRSPRWQKRPIDYKIASRQLEYCPLFLIVLDEKVINHLYFVDQGNIG